MKTRIETYKGKDMPAQIYKRISKIWQKEFTDEEPLEAKNRKRFADDIFFIVLDSNNRILSTGRLIPINIEFLGKEYKIMGIGDIAAVKKRKGHGKILMTAIHKYLERTKQTGIGFCSPKNAPFYIKCNFKIAKTFVKRFYKRKSNGKIQKSKWQGAYTIYLDGKNNLMKKILSHPRTRIYTSRLHW
ncbi:GNAT family N-acetyltransferase [Candidatus Woesearchaeota archaeon]|nr:GNAT family N-acetyltransferase [Candidatus Woesearchaeota archaeon]